MSHIPFQVTVTLTSDLVVVMDGTMIFKIFCVRSISLIFFEVGIPNLVCICILGWWNLTYCLLATVTLTSDLV